jgi:hypothetical protein
VSIYRLWRRCGLLHQRARSGLYEPSKLLSGELSCAGSTLSCTGVNIWASRSQPRNC